MNSGRLYCGGSLIDSTHILTAAHCVSGMSPQSISKLSVILGTVNLNDAGKTTKRIKSVTLHKQFDSAKMVKSDYRLYYNYNEARLYNYLEYL